MEFRCSTCSHVGAPAAVTPKDGEVLLTCANCGMQSGLEIAGMGTIGSTEGATESSSNAIVPNVKPKPAQGVGVSKETREAQNEKNEVEVAAFERIRPIYGEGERCRKCAHLLGTGEFCARCGLSVSESLRFAAGEAPWEQASPGNEGQHAQAMALWNLVADEPNDENFDKFLAFVGETDQQELTVRLLRFFLIENPHHPRATEALRDVATAFQRSVVIAQATSKARARNFEAKTQDIKRYIFVTMSGVWTIVLILFVISFVSKNC